MQAPLSPTDKLLSVLQPSRLIAISADRHTSPPQPVEMLARLAVQGVPCGVIVANNQFDVYRIGNAAEGMGGTREVALSRVHVLRAETCQQLHGCLRRLIAQPPRFLVLMIIGFLEPFYDEDIRHARALWLLNDSLRRLRTLTERGLSVLVTISAPPTLARRSFVALLQRRVDVSLTLDAPRRLPTPEQGKLEL